MGAALAAQRARRLESNPDTSEENFENIQGAWKEAIALAAGGQRDSYERELKRVRKDAAQFMLKKAQSAASLSNADTDETQELIEHVRRQLQSLAEQYGNDVQVVLWQAELAKVGGQYSYRPNRRREYFQSMESLAQNAQQRASNRHEKDQAARLLKESREGKNVAQKMDEIQSDFHQNSPKSLRNARQKWDEIRQDYGDLAVLQNWWDSLTRNKIAEIKRGINEDAPQISVHELRPIAMVAMLNPDYELGRDMLNNLGDHWSNLSEEVEQVINNATKAEGIQGDTGKAILNQQQKEIQQMLRNLEMMSYLPDLFPARNDISHIPSEAKEKLAALEKEHDDLKSLEQDINTISMTFQTDKKLGDLSETRNALDQVMRKYTRDNHAAYRLLFQQYRDANRRLNELRQVTESVRTAVKDENYDRAWSELNKTSQSNLSEYGLDETFEIVEPKRGDLLVGYDQILETVRKRRGAIRDVMAFAVLVDLQGENDIPTLDIHSEQYDDLLRKRARSAVNWPRQRDIATRNVHKGQFEAAKQVIREAIGGPIDSKTLPLEEVIAYLEAPPYVEAVTEEEKQAAVTPMQRYTLAIEKAGTVAGAELLMHLRDEVLPAYEQQLAEAEAMLTEDSTAASDENIYFAEQKFEQSWEQWQQSVDSIGTAMSSPHLKAGGRKPDKDSLRQIAETIYKAYVDCEETCADHPRLEEMRELWIWKEIARLMDMSHPTGRATNGFEEL